MAYAANLSYYYTSIKNTKELSEYKQVVVLELSRDFGLDGGGDGFDGVEPLPEYASRC